MRPKKLRIGTSGWTYQDWRGVFYPEELPAKERLSWYSEQFNSTEINGSFYRTPSLKAVEAWRDQTRDDFIFAWKASKFITHWKRLSEKCGSSLELMEPRLTALEPKVGPVLFQLPPQFKANRERLASFIKLLNKRRQYAFEFRSSTWYQSPVLDLLRDHNMALCISDHHDAPAPWEVTASHVYVRGHGPTGEYRQRYSTNTLKRWGDRFSAWRRHGLTVYCYFDNDQKSAAPLDARHLSEVCSRTRKSHR